MNGAISLRLSIDDGFEPSARLNSKDTSIGVVEIADRTEIILYSADEARRYAAAFTRAAELLAASCSPASCGHPRNLDGECDCASWPERASL